MQNTTTITHGGNEIRVKRTLGFADTLGFMEDVLGLVVDEETGDYRPELFDFACAVALLTRFTDIALPRLEGGDIDFEALFGLTMCTDLCFQLKQELDADVYYTLCNDAREKVNYAVRRMEAANTAKLNELLDSFAQLREMTRDVFSGVGGAGLKDMVDRLSGMDEAALAKAVLAEQEESE